MVIYKKQIKIYFYIFLTIHLILWTLIPSLTNNNLPLDTIEALAWGSNLDWSFNKHPPMSAFMVEIFYSIFGSNDWAYYLLSQIFIIFSFFVFFNWFMGQNYDRSLLVPLEGLRRAIQSSYCPKNISDREIH